MPNILAPLPRNGLRKAPGADWRPCAYERRVSLETIDIWIGKTLLVPPIVRFCQVTRQSQSAVSRLFWFVAAFDGFYRADTPFSAILFGALSIVMMVTASLRASA